MNLARLAAQFADKFRYRYQDWLPIPAIPALLRHAV
jgi:hypothetical protein